MENGEWKMENWTDDTSDTYVIKFILHFPFSILNYHPLSINGVLQKYCPVNFLNYLRARAFMK